MHAFLSNARHLRPHPARDGFFVYLDIDDDSVRDEYNHAAEPGAEVSTTFQKDVELEEQLSIDSESEQMDDQGDSSVDSFGPHTPPRFGSPPIQECAKHKSPLAQTPC
jgi:hypothetical protein